MTTLPERIQAALNSTEPKSKARRKALAGIRWRLRYGLLCAGLDQRQGLLAPPLLLAPDDPRVLIFSGLDNEEMKARFYGAWLGCKFEIEML